ncbi:hypothetical protein [Pedobacter kyungheensis]|nr:hypothetical protein [Pedobacter kyungheensis]
MSIGLLTFCSCKAPLKNRSEVFSYIDEERNGLVKSNQSNGIDCKVNFLPWQLQASNKSQSEIAINEKTKNTFKSQYYFLISFSKDKKELLRQLSANEYSEMVQTLAFRMTDYIKIRLADGKVIKPLSCLFQQTYGLSNANQLLVIFNQADFKTEETFTILINEFGFRTGNLSFSFELNQQQKLQELLPS